MNQVKSAFILASALIVSAAILDVAWGTYSGNGPFLFQIVDGIGGVNKASVNASNELKVNCSTGCGSGTTNVTQFGGNNILTGTGAGGVGIPRVTLSNDSSLAANQSMNEAQIAGTAVDVNSGTKSAGTQRVVLATDQPALTNKLLVTPDANSAVNVAQFAGANAVTGTGAGGAGIPRVTVSSDSALAGSGTHTLTTSQFFPGTNGFSQAAFSVLTTELNTLASAGVATSSVNGTSGKFSQVNSGSQQFGRCWVTLGGALGGAASAGANFSIWYLTSTDGGTTFESQTVSPPPRTPDLVIPVGANAYGANAVLMSPARVPLWAETVKMVFQNNTGQAMAASGNIMTCAGEGYQY